VSRVAFFDLDRTLIDVNSGKLWLREEWGNGRIGLRVGLRAVYWFTRYSLGDDVLDRGLAEAAAVYTGVPADQLGDRISAWFAADVAYRMRPGARAAIDAHRAAGDRIVLATSSSQFAVACAVSTFGLDDGIGTTLEIADGVLTGRIGASAFGRQKLTRCEEWARAEGVDLSDCAFYTDAYADRTLLEVVGQPVVVHPDRRLARLARSRGWPVEDWGDAVTR
jgi:HAD superfamily hydrolase (TIGR01490 family)